MRFWTPRATGDVVLDHVLCLVGHGSSRRLRLAVKRGWGSLSSRSRSAGPFEILFGSGDLQNLTSHLQASGLQTLAVLRARGEGDFDALASCKTLGIGGLG